MRTFILQNLFIEIITQHLRRCMVATFIMVNRCMICHILLHETMGMVLRKIRFNAVGVAPLIAQGCQTIVQATLG